MATRSSCCCRRTMITSVSALAVSIADRRTVSPNDCWLSLTLTISALRTGGPSPVGQFDEERAPPLPYRVSAHWLWTSSCISRMSAPISTNRRSAWVCAQIASCRASCAARSRSATAFSMFVLT